MPKRLRAAANLAGTPFVGEVDTTPMGIYIRGKIAELITQADDDMEHGRPFATYLQYQGGIDNGYYSLHNMERHDPRMRVQTFGPEDGTYPVVAEGPNPRSARDEKIAALDERYRVLVWKAHRLYTDPTRVDFAQGGMTSIESNEYKQKINALIDDAQRSGIQTRALERLITRDLEDEDEDEDWEEDEVEVVDEIEEDMTGQN